MVDFPLQVVEIASWLTLSSASLSCLSHVVVDIEKNTLTK